MIILAIYVLLALGFSFVCSLLEATLLTITPTEVESAKQQGKRWAFRMEAIKKDIDQPLSAILTLNTIAHTMGATGAGAQYVKVFGDTTGGIFAGLLTLAVLVFTEIIPKTLGARYARFFSVPTAWFLPWLQGALGPVVWMCRQVTRLITFGKANEGPRHREDLLAVARLGEQTGDLRSEEGRMVRNILELGTVPVAQIMTPRPVMFTLPESLTLGEFAEQTLRHTFSRIPVYRSSADELSGFVLRSEALLGCVANPEQLLAEVQRPLDSVPNIMRVDRLFRRMLRDHQHMSLVHDEHGTTVGLVTLEDVLETVLGAEIMDEHDQVADMQDLARKLWQKRAQRMGVGAEPEDDEGHKH